MSVETGESLSAWDDETMNRFPAIVTGWFIVAFIAPGVSAAEPETLLPVEVETHPEGCFAACVPLELWSVAPGEEVLLWSLWCKTSIGVSILILSTNDQCNGIGEDNCDHSTLCHAWGQNVDTPKREVRLPPRCITGLEVRTADKQIVDPEEDHVLAPCNDEPFEPHFGLA